MKGDAGVLLRPTKTDGVNERPPAHVDIPADGSWKNAQITVRGDVVVLTLNERKLGSVKWDEGSRYGRLAIRNSKGDVCLKVFLTDFFYSEGISAGLQSRPRDLSSRDHQPQWFLERGGPDQPQAGAIVHGSYAPSFFNFVSDFNGDGWPDILEIMAFGPLSRRIYS